MRAWIVAVLVLLASATAHAETVVIKSDYGGLLVAYEMKWQKLAAEGANVRIAGPCLSACTALVGYFPRKRICVTPEASFGFHQAFPPFITPQLWKDYPPDIQKWITDKGGLTYQVMWLQAPDIFKFFQKCPA
jgi:hypothetical protein